MKRNEIYMTLARRRKVRILKIFIPMLADAKDAILSYCWLDGDRRLITHGRKGEFVKYFRPVNES